MLTVFEYLNDKKMRRESIPTVFPEHRHVELLNRRDLWRITPNVAAIFRASINLVENLLTLHTHVRCFSFPKEQQQSFKKGQAKSNQGLSEHH